MADLPRAIDALERALDAGEDVLDPAVHGKLRRDLDAVARRHGFLGPTVVAALAGGTGSGKSTVLNALAGEPLAETGVLRPTTSAPVAWVPQDPDPNLLALLDDLGIDRRIGHGAGEHLAVVDLPDLDSLELSHHATVDALLPRVDVIVWILDPLKYNDRAIHRRIAARSRYERQLLFVLNQIDRLDEDEVAAVVDDLERSLVADGIADPDIVLTAAAPADGAPHGLDVLARRLDERAREKRLVLDRLRTDLENIAERLAAELGPAPTIHAQLLRTWEDAEGEAARALAHGIVDDVARVRAERAGARTAVTIGSGPAGRLWHLFRRSLAGRALGLPKDEPFRPELLGQQEHDPTTDRAAITLSRAVTTVSTALDGAAGRRLRTELDPQRVGRELAGALEGARATVRAGSDATPRIPRRAWWVGAAALQTLLTIAVVIGAAWWWMDPGAVTPGDVPWPAILVLGGIVAMIVIARLVRASGRAAGRRLVEQRRSELRAAITTGIDERVGATVRELLDHHGRVGDAVHDARRAL